MFNAFEDTAGRKETTVPKLELHAWFDDRAKEFWRDDDAFDIRNLSGFEGGWRLDPHSNRVQTFHSFHPHGNPPMQSFIEHEPSPPFRALALEVELQHSGELRNGLHAV
jgi:hypothetical protein